jgi:DNA-binding response OmpR family regulator
MTLLLAEDDLELARQVQEALAEAGHNVHWVTTGGDALEQMRQRTWDLVLMDVSMPGLTGFDVVRHMRQMGNETPVMFLTARSEVADRVEGLTLGGDDYLTKPFAMSELQARIVALMRRFKRAPAHEVKLPKGWRLDPVKRAVVTSQAVVELQPREWSLLEVLLLNPGQINTKSFLLERVWNVQFDPGTNVVDAAVCRLRRKLDCPSQPSHIETLRGRGYVFHLND